MDEIDVRLLNTLQGGLPLHRRPYAVVAEALGITEAETLYRIRRLQEQKIIRRMTGLFDSEKLGYVSVLCGAKVAEEDIAAASDFLMQFPGITHNYLRKNEHNMWFTLISPDRGQLEQVLSEVAQSGLFCELVKLYTAKKYKINTNFTVGGIR